VVHGLVVGPGGIMATVTVVGAIFNVSVVSCCTDSVAIVFAATVSDGLLNSAPHRVV